LNEGIFGKIVKRKRERKGARGLEENAFGYAVAGKIL